MSETTSRATLVKIQAAVENMLSHVDGMLTEIRELKAAIKK